MGAAIVLGVIVAVMLGITAYLFGSLIVSIRREEGMKGLRNVWRGFGLSVAFSTLFLVSWITQVLAEWQVFVDEGRMHGEATRVGDFLASFAQSTLENWQSEFLQLFSFTVLAALLIHKGSAESRDSDDRMEKALRRIEERLEKAKL